MKLTTWPELASGLIPDSIKQKYPQTGVSTWVVPGCVQFLGEGKALFMQSGPKAVLRPSAACASIECEDYPRRDILRLIVLKHDEDRMERRKFIAAGAALLVPPRRSWAQGTPRRIGFLGAWADEPSRDPVHAAWLSGLHEKGWIEGKNLLVEYRFAPDRLPALAAELVALTPELIIASGTQAAMALKSATSTIPIVSVGMADPVAAGLVQSLSHPGGNMTGLTSVVPGDFIGKQIEILRELVPGASKIALLVNPGNLMHRLALAEELPRTARKLNIVLPTVEATKAEELKVAFASAADQHADAIVVLGDYVTIFQAARVAALAAEYHLPAIYFFRQFAPGGLVVYGPELQDLFRRAGGYVDKILKGAKPSDLPVEQPTKFELVINMKTAKALGLTVPSSLLVRADEVIE
jgi:putative ABC transport system substrate-binding protein